MFDFGSRTWEDNFEEATVQITLSSIDQIVSIGLKVCLVAFSIGGGG
jgi:hypothetical protein